MRERLRFDLACTLMCLATLAAGCSRGNSNSTVFPVQGTVLVKGKPAAYAKVSFIPVDENVKETSSAYGVANEDGKFQLSMRTPQDGARAGEYYVAVSWRIPENPRSSDDPQYSTELLPRKFQNPQESGLKVEINSKDAVLPPIELNP